MAPASSKPLLPSIWHIFPCRFSQQTKRLKNVRSDAAHPSIPGGPTSQLTDLCHTGMRNDFTTAPDTVKAIDLDLQPLSMLVTPAFRGCHPEDPKTGT
eukprot:2375371-Amphidinium_carterae.1